MKILAIKSSGDRTNSGDRSKHVGRTPPDTGGGYRQSSSTERSTDVIPYGICHQYYRHGNCHRGPNCRWKHERPEQGQPRERGRSKERRPHEYGRGEKRKQERRSISPTGSIIASPEKKFSRKNRNDQCKYRCLVHRIF